MAGRSARRPVQVVPGVRPNPADKAGVRQRQTLRAGCIWPKSFSFRLGRGATTTFAESLDLGPNVLRQSDPKFTGNALSVSVEPVVKRDLISQLIVLADEIRQEFVQP